MNDDTFAALRAGRLQGIRRLDLSCGLREFPREIFDLADTLEVLNLSGNALDALPDDLHRLPHLKVLFCSDNRFTHVPEVLGQCAQLDIVGFKANRITTLPAAALPPRLRWLILTDNALTELPPTLGQCSALQKLMLAGNALTHLPDELAACRRLELLRIAANRFEALPDWLLTLPRLAWLAFGGNPLTARFEVAPHDVPAIDWHTLRLEAVLGQGASGVIHQASWARPGQAPVPVAVKLFKGQVTSDGLPTSEMAACIAAQPHAQVMAVLGPITGHPEGTPGLVMPLIAPSFSALAGPPSLQSCTRDIYDPATRFTAASAKALALGLADAARHLHTRGLMHGDLYAHNTLWNGVDQALLGDFGAASFVPPAQADALERIEVRAFGCLLEELIERCEAPPPGWAHLRDRCQQEAVDARPSFAEIVHSLRG